MHFLQNKDKDSTMKKLLSAAVFTVIVAVYAQGVSAVPAHNMTPFTMGLEYHATAIGHPTLYVFDSSAFVSHFARLHYSPCRFVRFSGGIGGTHPYNSSVDPLGDNPRRGSKMGFSATGGGALILPKLLPVLSITAGFDGSYLKYTEEDTLYILDSKSDTVLFNFNSFGKTIGKVYTPYFGLIFHPNRFVDIEIGGMYKIFDMNKNRTNRYWGWQYSYTTMTADTVVTLEDGSTHRITISGDRITDSTRVLDSSRTRSVEEQLKEMRVYGSVTLNEPRSGTYLTFGASAAPSVDSKYKTNNWLTRSSIWISAGVLLKDPFYRSARKAHGRYSGGYRELKLRQNEMAQDLLTEIDLDIYDDENK